MKNFYDSPLTDLDNTLRSMKIPDEMLDILGVQKEDLKTLKDLTDFYFLVKVVKGDLKAKAYCDEQYWKEKQLEAMNGKPLVES
jgi:hypothetical protein